MERHWGVVTSTRCKPVRDVVFCICERESGQKLNGGPIVLVLGKGRVDAGDGGNSK